MENWPALAGVAALALLCDRMLAWMERRGWIYWRAGTPARVDARRWAPLRDTARASRPPRRQRKRLGGRPRPRG